MEPPPGPQPLHHAASASLYFYNRPSFRTVFLSSHGPPRPASQWGTCSDKRPMSPSPERGRDKHSGRASGLASYPAALLPSEAEPGAGVSWMSSFLGTLQIKGRCGPADRLAQAGASQSRLQTLSRGQLIAWDAGLSPPSPLGRNARASVPRQSLPAPVQSSRCGRPTREVPFPPCGRRRLRAQKAAVCPRSPKASAPPLPPHWTPGKNSQASGVYFRSICRVPLCQPVLWPGHCPSTLGGSGGPRTGVKSCYLFGGLEPTE